MADEDLMSEDVGAQPTITQPDIVPSGAIKLQAQIEALQKALDQRMNMPFNPMMMALAAGFLKPTQTGSFGESLGYAAEGAATAAEKERSRRSEVEKMKLELALKQYDLSRKEQARGMLKNIMSGDRGAPPTTPTQAPSQSGGEPEQTSTPQLKEVTPEQAVKIAQRMPNAVSQMKLTPDIVMAISEVDPETGAMAQKAFENQAKLAGLQQKDIEILQGRYKPDAVGIFDTQIGQYISKNPKGSVRYPDPVDPTNKEGLYIPEDLIPELNKLRGRPKEEVIQFLRKNNIPTIYTAEDEQPAQKEEGKVGPTIIPLPKTMEERNLVIRQREQEMGGDSPAGKAIGNLQDNALNSGAMISTSMEAIDLATSNPNAFKQLMNKDVRTAMDKIKAAASEGFQVPFGTLALPKDTIRKLNLSTGDIMALQKFAQLEGIQTLMARKAWLTGQGAVANAENNLAASIGPQSSDRPEVIRMKSEAIIEKAKFNQQVADAYEQFTNNNPVTGTWNRFLHSREYKEAEKAYVEKLDRMSKANSAYLSGKSVSKKPSATQAPSAPKPGSLYQQIKEESQGQEGQ